MIRRRLPLMMPTASGLDDAVACPASQVFHQSNRTNEAAERGTWCHGYIDAVSNGTSPEVAASQIPHQYRSWCMGIDVDGMLDGWSHLRTESPIAIDMSGPRLSARWLAKSKHRDYQTVSPSEFAGTLDRFGIYEESWCVDDYKTGSELGDPSSKLQLRFAALGVSLMNPEAETLVPSFTYINVDSTHARVVGRPLDAWDHADTELILRKLRADIYHASAILDAGGVPTTYPGDNCKFCDAFGSCPSTAGLMKHLMGWDVAEVHELTPSQLAEVWHAYTMAKTVVSNLGPVIGNVVDQTDIPLDGDDVVRMYHSSKESLNAPKLAALARRLGASQDDISSCMVRNSFSYPRVGKRRKS